MFVLKFIFVQGFLVSYAYVRNWFEQEWIIQEPSRRNNTMFQFCFMHKALFWCATPKIIEYLLWTICMECWGKTVPKQHSIILEVTVPKESMLLCVYMKPFQMTSPNQNVPYIHYDTNALNMFLIKKKKISWERNSLSQHSWKCMYLKNQVATINESLSQYLTLWT